MAESKSNDRIFIDKFDNFLFTIRKMIYFGDTNSAMQPKDPKHDKQRFINYFGAMSNESYYDNKSFSFSNDDKLKDEFANIYMFKSMNIAEMGDCFQLFSSLDCNEAYSGDKLLVGSARNAKNFKRRIEAKSELAESGSVIIKKGSPVHYLKNADPVDNFTEDEKDELSKALDFAIKKNNFTAFASTYKKLLCARDSVEDLSCNIGIDHQLFHPILDEHHIWTAVSALMEHCYLEIDYNLGYPNSKKLAKFKNCIALRIVYDNLYGRTYLFTYDEAEDKINTLRFDKIYSIKIKGNYKNIDLVESKQDELCKKLETAWLVSTDNEELEHVVIEFKNTPSNRARVENEGRHGVITKFDDDFFTYEIDVNDHIEMINWVLNYGSSCRVREPKEFVDRIVTHLEEMAK